MNNRRRRFRLTRPLQIGFLVLLGISSAQLAWWLYDQVHYTGRMRAWQLEAYQADTAAAAVLLRHGVSPGQVRGLYPHLTIASDGMSAVVTPAYLARLDHDRRARLNRYAWEGGFFLVVLLGAMAVVSRALHEETELRRRQENFLAAVSHELKSPLASLRLSAETLALRDPPPPQRGDLVRRLLDDLGRLERMIKNTLDTSRLAGASPKTVPQPVPLADEVAAVVDEMSLQAQEFQVSLATDVDPGLVVQADQEGVRTVLRNLVDNALRSAPGGNVTIRGVRHDTTIALTVEDDGIGFAPAERDRLFERFYRIEGEGRGRASGTGLGLYLVRRCMELDGGTASAESAGPGRGARFSVTWGAAETRPG